MNKPYYELHITIELRKPYGIEEYGCPTDKWMYRGRSAIKKLIEDCNWKFSAIDGDINLGDGIKLYATTQMNKKHELDNVKAILQTMADALVNIGANVVRMKIEEVMYDHKVTAQAITDGK